MYFISALHQKWETLNDEAQKQTLSVVSVLALVIAFTVVMMLGISGCTPTATQTASAQIASAAVSAASKVDSSVDVAKAGAYTCVTATAALKTITPYASKLSEAQRSAVNSSLSVINPICSSGQAPTAGSLQAEAFTFAVTELSKVAAQVGSGASK